MNAVKMKPREVKEMLAELERRFGFDPTLFRDHDFYVNTKNKIFIIGRLASALIDAYPKRLANAGMLFARRDAAIKPSSNMIQAFGSHARKNVVELDRVKAHIYIEGFDVELKQTKASDGYVILRYGRMSLGCGLLKDGQLKNVIPKAKRMRLKYL